MLQKLSIETLIKKNKTWTVKIMILIRIDDNNWLSKRSHEF